MNHNQKYKILCLLNNVAHSTIPLENLSILHSKYFDKYVAALNQSQGELDDFNGVVYPHSELKVYGIKDQTSRQNIFKRTFILKHIIKSINPDIVHVHHTISSILGILICSFEKTITVITAHSNFSKYNIKQKLTYSISYSLANVVICNSQNTMLSLPKFVRGKKTQVIYNGVNFEKLDKAIQLAQQYNIHNESLNIGTMCRMVPAKDLITLVAGFEKLLEMCSSVNLKLTLVGDGPEKSSLLEMVKEYDLWDRVRFTGNLSRNDAYVELAKMDVFVVSSRWEGFCNAMVEAAGAGKPVVATNIEPLPEVIGRDNALFFDVGDSQALANLLHELVHDPEKRKTLGQQAKDFVRSRYSLEKSAREHEKLYQSLAEKRNISGA